VAEWLSRLRERLLASFHPIPKTNKTFSGEDARTHSRCLAQEVKYSPSRRYRALRKNTLVVGTETLNPLHSVVLDMDLLFQLPLIQTKDVDSRLRVEPTRGAKYVACDKKTT
jgi:hypothetical protein